MSEPTDGDFEMTLRAQGDPLASFKRRSHRFYLEEIEDAAASVTAGRPIYRTEEMIEIFTPGDKDNILVERVRKVKPDPREVWPDDYARFKRGEGHEVKGTSLNEWGKVPRSVAREYAYFGIYTVEQLADVNDVNAQKIPGILAHRQMAKDWLAEMKGQEPIAEARAEIAKLRAELEALREAQAPAAPQDEEPDPSHGAAPKRLGRPPGSKNKPKVPEA